MAPGTAAARFGGATTSPCPSPTRHRGRRWPQPQSTTRRRRRGGRDGDPRPRSRPPVCPAAWEPSPPTAQVGSPPPTARDRRRPRRVSLARSARRIRARSPVSWPDLTPHPIAPRAERVHRGRPRRRGQRVPAHRGASAGSTPDSPRRPRRSTPGRWPAPWPLRWPPTGCAGHHRWWPGLG